MISYSRLAAALGAAGLLMLTAAGSDEASAQTPTISIGRITAHQNCKVYQESAGRSAVVARRDTVAAAAADGSGAVAAVAQRETVAAVSSWRTWLVKDCVSDFPSIRTSLQAALAASGKLIVKSGGGKYVLSGAISQVGGDENPATNTVSTSTYSISSQKIFVSMEVTLRDDSGRIVYGGLLTKHLEVGSNIQTPGMETSSSQSGEAVYTELQNQVALAVARLTAFHIVPLQVVGNDGRQIRLNYGAPLLTLGTMVDASSPDGMTKIRYNVVSADAGGATAEKYGEGDGDRIVPGSTATAVEADSPEASARSIPRVDLP